MKVAVGPRVPRSPKAESLGISTNAASFLLDVLWSMLADVDMNDDARK